MSLLSVRDLKVYFPTPRGTIHAVDGVDLELGPGETLGLVGESGCGKSTLGKAVMRLIEPTAGRIVLDGVDITHLKPRNLAPLRAKVQMIFQDPYASLNPRATTERILEEPLIVNNWGPRSARKERVLWLLDKVGLRPEALKRHPHEFSGGQRQRIGIARAIALNPKMIVCDEAVSALDVSIRAQIINLLADLRDELGLSYLFISHDLSVIRHISDRVAVMYMGKIVEIGDRDGIWARPLHPYTRSLMSAIPIPDPKASRARVRIMPSGEIPSPLAPPRGCRFHTRCRFAEEICRREEPPLREARDGHAAACHFVVADADGSFTHPGLDREIDDNEDYRSRPARDD